MRCSFNRVCYQLFSFDDFDIMRCSFNRVCYHSSIVVAYILSYLALMILTLYVVVSIEYVIIRIRKRQ